jgi:glutamyl-tRNA reductase
MLGVVGVNYKSSSLQLREKLVFNEGEIVELIGAMREEEPDAELVVLSTCNRTELYFNLPESCVHRDFNYLIKRMILFKDLKDEVRRHFYTYGEREAVTHLFEVASGLNSMVLGENQVLGQVKEAYRISASRKNTRTVLNRLFHRAFEVGKRVRTETAINEGALSISSAAVELASRIFNELAAHPVLLIGAGETGELVLQCLCERGTSHVHIANRTLERAQHLSEKYNAQAVPLQDLPEYLVHCDIIVSSTSAPEHLVSFDAVKRAVAHRHNRPIFFIDLSVPRDVEEEVKKLQNVFVYDIDDLEAVVAHNYERRKGEIEKAGEIIAQHTSDFYSWLSSLSLSPTITGLKDKLSTIVDDELNSLKNKLSQSELEKVSKFAKYVEGKYLGLVVKNLKKLSNNGRQLEYIDMVCRLFELEEEDKE